MATLTDTSPVATATGSTTDISSPVHLMATVTEASVAMEEEEALEAMEEALEAMEEDL